MNPNTATINPQAPLMHDVMPPRAPIPAVPAAAHVAAPAPSPAPGTQPVRAQLVQGIPVRQRSDQPPAAAPQVIGNPISGSPGSNSPVHEAETDKELDMILQDVNTKVKDAENTKIRNGKLSAIKNLVKPDPAAVSASPPKTLLALSGVAVLCLVSGALMR